MPVTPPFARAPLAETVHLLDAINPELNPVHLGLADDDPGWVTCRDVVDDPARTRRWADALEVHLAEVYPDVSAPDLRRTAAAATLDSYAFAAGFFAGAMFHLARRVPRLAPDVVAFRVHPVEQWVNGVALLDDRFWCLPGDPAAGHPSATVVADERALADEARGQVHAHATAFLATYDPGVGIGHRARIGAFVDAFDSAPWIAAEAFAPLMGCLATSALLLPGGAHPLPEGSRLYRLVDDRARSHVTRRRLFCCHHHLVGEACMDCPRLTEARRRAMAAELPDPGPVATEEER